MKNKERKVYLTDWTPGDVPVDETWEVVAEGEDDKGKYVVIKVESTKAPKYEEIVQIATNVDELFALTKTGRIMLKHNSNSPWQEIDPIEVAE